MSIIPAMFGTSPIGRSRGCRLLIPLILLLSAGPGCSDFQGSACIAGEACERVLLHHCTCCAGYKAIECRLDRQERCSGGGLVVPWTDPECQGLNEEWAADKAAGLDPCSRLTEEEREQACTNFDSEGLPDEPRQQEPQTF